MVYICSKLKMLTATQYNYSSHLKVDLLPISGAAVKVLKKKIGYIH